MFIRCKKQGSVMKITPLSAFERALTIQGITVSDNVIALYNPHFLQRVNFSHQLNASKAIRPHKVNVIMFQGILTLNIEIKDMREMIFCFKNYDTCSEPLTVICLYLLTFLSSYLLQIYFEELYSLLIVGLHVFVGLLTLERT